MSSIKKRVILPVAEYLAYFDQHKEDLGDVVLTPSWFLKVLLDAWILNGFQTESKTLVDEVIEEFKEYLILNDIEDFSFYRKRKAFLNKLIKELVHESTDSLTPMLERVTRMDTRYPVDMNIEKITSRDLHMIIELR